jgi:WD40 repeat protein
VILWDANNGAVVERLPGRNWVTALAFAPGKDAGLLALADADNQVLLWDVSTTPAVSTTLTESLSARVGALAFDLQGTLLYGGDAQGRIFQWDVARQRLNTTVTQQSGLPISSLAIDPTGKLLAAASYDNALYLWRLPSLRPQGSGVLVGHTRPASSVAFHPNGKLLASSSLDGSIILWDVETQQQVGSPLRGHGAPVNAVAFSPNGRWLASGGDDHAVILWPMTSDAWVDTACRIVDRSLTAAEVEQYLAGRPARACVAE